MLRYNLVASFRKLIKDKAFTDLNIPGPAIGMSSLFKPYH